LIYHEGIFIAYESILTPFGMLNEFANHVAVCNKVAIARNSEELFNDIK
jgi:hypothetical protein